MAVLLAMKKKPALGSLISMHVSIVVYSRGAKVTGSGQDRFQPTG